MAVSDLREQAHQLLVGNTRTAVFNGTTVTFTIPSEKQYPFQWFWDSCFHAIVWTHFDIQRAQEEILSLLSVQRPHGFLPHIIYWDRRLFQRAPWNNHWQETRGRWSFLPQMSVPHTSELIQPPVLADAVWKICATSQDTTFLSAVLPDLDRYYHWLRIERDPDHDGLISIIAPYESGIDASPAYDALLGITATTGTRAALLRFRSLMVRNKLLFDYDQQRLVRRGSFHVEDVLVNALFAKNLGVLAQLHERLGDTMGARAWNIAALRVTNALVQKCWNEERGSFFNLDGRQERKNSVLSIHSLMPLVIPWLPKEIVERLVRNHLTNPNEFLLPFSVPSVAANEPMFSAQSYLPATTKRRFLWRGSTWINTNWYLIHGLRQHGFDALADALTVKTQQLVEQNGFREYYDPFTGEGFGAENFGWSTLVIDL